MDGGANDHKERKGHKGKIAMKDISALCDQARHIAYVVFVVSVFFVESLWISTSKTPLMERDCQHVHT